MTFDAIRHEIATDPANAWAMAKGWGPVYTAHPSARLLIVGQAPGIRAQESGVPWNDPSGDTLRKWLGLDRETFYDPAKIAILPMDFYFPGSAERGDIPPRKGFAEKWHPRLLAQMPEIRLTLLVGQYAQAGYLGAGRKLNLTETVRSFDAYLPQYLPLVHPSPRNNIWHKRNPWFSEQVVPKARALVSAVFSER